MKWTENTNHPKKQNADIEIKINTGLKSLSQHALGKLVVIAEI